MLEVSRPDVNWDVIVERPVNERFIKLPIIPYLKLVPVDVNGRRSTVYEEINRPQIALINAVNDPKYRFICAALSRRLGKTYISNVIGQLVSLVPNCNILIMSPNFNLSSISFELQHKFIATFDLETTRDNRKDKIIELSNGSEIRMGSVSTVDSSVGRSYDLIIFDEAALSEGGKEAFEVSLRPTLDRPGAKAIFISTPRGKKNWFSEFYARGWSDEFPEWCSIRADYTENTRMLASDVAEARRSMTKAKFEQEYMASFLSYEGQIFSVKEDLNIIDEFELHDGCEFFAGLDPGYKDPLAFVVICYSPRDDCFYIVDEYLNNESTTKQHVERIQELITKWGIDSIFIDSAAAQFAADLAYIYDIATTKGKKEVLPGIAAVQTLIETGRLKIVKSCVETLTAFDQYQWDQRETLTREKPVHEFSHIPDAVRYALHTYTL
jgi:Terminase large subunit, T4likevirus-type, N-terminal/Terminase RNaseH-like domain